MARSRYGSRTSRVARKTWTPENLSSLASAYGAKNPGWSPPPVPSEPTPAQATWTPQNLQGLANAYSALNPTWTPPADQNAALPNPISPVKFDPYGDVSYAAGASAIKNSEDHAKSEYGYTDEHGVFHPGYQTHRGRQEFGYDEQGKLVTSGADLNPYAQAAILKRNYDATQRGTTNSYASRGQLYSGAIQNARAENNFGYGQQTDRLQRTAADFYHGNTTAVQGVQDAGMFQLAQLLGPAVANFLASQRGS